MKVDEPWLEVRVCAQGRRGLATNPECSASPSRTSGVWRVCLEQNRMLVAVQCGCQMQRELQTGFRLFSKSWEETGRWEDAAVAAWSCVAGSSGRLLPSRSCTRQFLWAWKWPSSRLQGKHYMAQTSCVATRCSNKITEQLTQSTPSK